MAKLIRAAADVPVVDRRDAQPRKVLLLLSRRGTATQEAVMPLAELRALGAEVIIGSSDAGDIVFDGPCNLLASLERLWSPVHRLHRDLQRQGLRAERVDPRDTEWLGRFDAVLIPGGHGPHYAEFIRSAFAQDVIRAFVKGGRLVALQCHSVFAATVKGPNGEAPIGAGRQVTCWPAAYERVLGSLPGIGRHFRPLGTLVQDLVAPVAAGVHAGANPWRMPHVVVDGPLVTSWGPWSGTLMGRALAAMIDARARDAGAFRWENVHAA